MRNSLQEQLLKAGLIDKNKAKAVVREQGKAEKQGKPKADTVDGKHLLAEKAAADRARALAENEQKKQVELQAQIRQIITHYKQKRDGEANYQFSDAGKIKSITVSEKMRSQIIKGHLIIVRGDDGRYELVPRAAAEMIRQRDISFIVIDNLDTQANSAIAEDDPYKDFPVPDDLMW